MSDHSTRAGPPTAIEREGGVRILLDPGTGLPAGIAPSSRAPVVPLALAIELEADGDEVPGTMGGLTYGDTNRYEAGELVPDSVEEVSRGPERAHVLDVDAGEWLVRVTITLRREHPRVALQVATSPRSPGAERSLRDLRLTAELHPADLDRWQVEAPGNTLRPGLRASAFAEPVTVLSASHHLGSPGLVAFHHDEAPVTLVIWPFSRAEQVKMALEPTARAPRLRIDTQLAGAIRTGEWLEHGPIYLDAVERPWSRVRAEIKSWYRSIGVSTPSERPSWSASVSLFEVMVGSAPFHGGYEYSPYPSFRELIDDLDRIADLGFQCLQLMPRHPYPSYNIHEPGDVATTYGPPQDLRELVAACHERGMRIILDILLHGVLDRAVLARTVELVERGPHAERLDDHCSDVFDFASVEISWCRHILAFAPHWMDGAPDRHPLLDSHPEWFMRDSRGQVTGVYTHALDIANEAWQDHFVGSCERLVRDFGIDGFRLDAPLYNRFANWSPPTRRHASYSSLGAFRLIRKLRRRLRSRSGEILLYSEPSGPLAREALDLNYAYEEQWLIPSLFDREGHDAHDWRRVRTGSELAAWFRDFDLALPAGSVSAHFIDAHDTIWWRLEGDLWRREQVGLEATKALLAIYALRGGAYMNFVGGEVGLEHELRLVHRLRRHLPEIHDGEADYGAVSVSEDAVYAVLRRSADRAAIVAVNTSRATLQATCTVAADRAHRRDRSGRVLDAWASEWLAAERAGDGALRLELELAPYQPRVVLLDEPPAELTRPHRR